MRIHLRAICAIVAPSGTSSLSSATAAESDVVRHAGERLANVEGFAVAVVAAVIVGREDRVGPHLSGEHPAGEGYANDHTDIGLRGEIEEPICRSLPENVEDYLHRLNTRVLDRLHRFLYPLDADAVVADFPRNLQGVEFAEQLGSVVDVGRRAVQLQEVEGVRIEIRQTAIDESLDVLAGVAVGSMGAETAPHLGGNNEVVAWPLPNEAGHEPLAAPVAVHIGRVDEADTGVDRSMEGSHSGVVVDVSPIGTDRPCPESDLRDVVAGASKPSIVHDVDSLGG